MKSKRREVQKWWEQKLGCNDLNQWPGFKSAVQAVSLNILDIPSLQVASAVDQKNYAINAILSFLEGMESIRSTHFAWGIIKLYYSVFYALRYEILASEHILLRCNSLFLMRLKDGESFKVVRTNKKNGDHQLTIKAVKDLVDSNKLSDPVLDNDIEGELSYMWLMSQRERVNYWEACFPDPDCDGCLIRPYEDYISHDKISELFDLYTSDSIMAYLHDKEHSMISIPFYRISRIINKVKWNDVSYQTRRHILTICNNLGITLQHNRTNNIHANDI